MDTKTYIVRDGFSFRQVDERGNLRVYNEGDSVELEPETGDAAHQLEAVAAGKRPAKSGSDD